MKIQKELRIRRTDNSGALALKVIHIARQLIYNDMKFKAIKWLYKIVDGISLFKVYDFADYWESENDG